jgi:hypothetical protein
MRDCVSDMRALDLPYYHDERVNRQRRVARNAGPRDNSVINRPGNTHNRRSHFVFRSKPPGGWRGVNSRDETSICERTRVGRVMIPFIANQLNTVTVELNGTI